MEATESSISAVAGDGEADGDQFFDALDEFPFCDCVDLPTASAEDDRQFKRIHYNAGVLLVSKPSPEGRSLANLRRRRALSQRIGRDIHGQDLVNLEPNESIADSAVDFTDRKYKFSWSSKENADLNVSKESNLMSKKHRISSELMENEKEMEKSVLYKAESSSEILNVGLNDQTKGNSVITCENDERVDESVTVDLSIDEINDSSSNFLVVIAGFVIKAIEFQVNLIVSLVTFPMKLIYQSYIFVLDPFRVQRPWREYLTRKLLRMLCAARDTVQTFVFEWLKEHKSIGDMALRYGWGILWSMYVCFVLVGLLVSAFVISGFVMRHLLEKPIQIKESLHFDYTKNSPVAHVPIMSCSGVSCGVDCGGRIEAWNAVEQRAIPPHHKLHASVSLTLPESDYNRNLGMFQIRVDFLAANGQPLASSSRPCMLHFKSQPLRLLLTFLKIAPLAAGFLSESQNLNVNFRGFYEGDMPTSCLRVSIEQRAEFGPGEGVPEIYDASLILKSELPLLRRILWYWKSTIFIWTSMTIFVVELLFTLLCCKPIILPRVRLRAASASSNAPQDNSPVQR